ncbi:50S ribosomal protein L25/general stress protein Ctc [Nocardiopsis sp. RSe5-2]|uniref:Large ribosomal subunit protein bL25 n=1 Tax=Nocardiopsis endophytica TaxID=3018445 RepID=A0ABT4U2Q3_9ACTN|nr:50S ribosomal protein L25/general stress protein Ctc [Nocardiopsis endophytica]MDA2811233.1 50S ribosomal protein L25/general stress protein Ctc [Nocardiopsis endophytica]
MSEVRIAAEPRTEFGKGAARRARRAGKVPAVLYGHGTEPRHITLPGHDLMLALKTPNVLLRVDGVEGRENLVLPKSVQRDPIKGFLEHVDLLVVKKGEKVNVEIAVNLTGDVASGNSVYQELVTVEVAAEATHIPEGVEHSVEGLEDGAHVSAGDLKLPAGVELVTDPEAWVASVSADQAAEAEESAEGESEGEGESAASESAE